MSMTSEWTQLTGSSEQEAESADAKRRSAGASMINQNVMSHMNRYMIGSSISHEVRKSNDDQAQRDSEPTVTIQGKDLGKMSNTVQQLQSQAQGNARGGNDFQPTW